MRKPARRKIALISPLHAERSRSNNPGFRERARRRRAADFAADSSSASVPGAAVRSAAGISDTRRDVRPIEHIAADGRRVALRERKF